MLRGIRSHAEHFPSHIRERGRSTLRDGRVGPLEIEARRISATVRGVRSYRTVWAWNGHDTDPLCTCAAGPVCKHAYALARAIDAARHELATQATGAARARARDERAGDERQRAIPGFDPRPDEPADERAHAHLAEDLAHWARRHAAARRCAALGAAGHPARVRAEAGSPRPRAAPCAAAARPRGDSAGRR